MIQQIALVLLERCKYQLSFTCVEFYDNILFTGFGDRCSCFLVSERKDVKKAKNCITLELRISDDCQYGSDKERRARMAIQHPAILDLL